MLAASTAPDEIVEALYEHAEASFALQDALLLEYHAAVAALGVEAKREHFDTMQVKFGAGWSA